MTTRLHAGKVYSTTSDGRQETVDNLLNVTGLATKLTQTPRVLIKPNLVEPIAPPITTPVQLIEQLINYIQKISPTTHIVIGEGTGSTEVTTFHCFDDLGYSEMAKRCNVELIDLNEEELIKKSDATYSRWPEIYLPAILDDHFLISVPVLKAHSLAKVTLTMKNMMGCAPPAHYQQGGSWGKSAFHTRIDEAVFDLNRYRTPDFTLLDASVGMAQAHLWGPHCDPPVETLAASWDPVAIDSFGTRLLGKDWQDIGHIRLANGELGVAEPLEIKTV